MDSNLQKYQAFVKTVETGSFTHAAMLLNYTQSSVSKMIADRGLPETFRRCG